MTIYSKVENIHSKAVHALQDYPVNSKIYIELNKLATLCMDVPAGMQFSGTKEQCDKLHEIRLRMEIINHLITNKQ